MARYSPTPVPQDDNQPLRQWLDGEFRRVAGSQPDQTLEGTAILYDGAANVIANDVTETPIINYVDSYDNGILVADPVAGSITLPNKAGIVDITAWVSLNQITVTRNFTVQLVMEIDSVWAAPILASGYIPQVGSSVSLGLSCSFLRNATASAVFRLGLLLDGASPAEFEHLDTTFEVSYLTVRG
ncbi:unnamed protein product [marine sediment metagenome]|uniref:Uncharacterized protein n=1 Tax=marine sediment metagenome TaxID=412755 RepID=X0UMM0_9ZZZZ